MTSVEHMPISSYIHGLLEMGQELVPRWPRGHLGHPVDLVVLQVVGAQLRLELRGLVGLSKRLLEPILRVPERSRKCHPPAHPDVASYLIDMTSASHAT